MGFIERGEVVNKHKITRKQVADGNGIVTVQEDASFAHDGSDYVWVLADGSHVAVRWSSVETYEVIDGD